MVLCCTSQKYSRIKSNGPILKEKVLQVSKELGVKIFKMLTYWLDKFKIQYIISFNVVYGKNKWVDTKTVNKWRIKVNKLISSHELRNIFNVDEIGLLYKVFSNRTLNFKNESCNSGKKSKE